MKTIMVVASGVLLVGLLWWGGVAGAAPSQKSAPASQAGEVMTLKIDGWTCASCEKDIRRALLAVPGVKSADVSYARGGAIVEIEPGRVTPDQLIQAVASAGNLLASYRARVVPNGTFTAEAGEQGRGWNWFENWFK
jgi:copper chaperone CopZ